MFRSSRVFVMLFACSYGILAFLCAAPTRLEADNGICDCVATKWTNNCGKTSQSATCNNTYWVCDFAPSPPSDIECQVFTDQVPGDYYNCMLDTVNCLQPTDQTQCMDFFCEEAGPQGFASGTSSALCHKKLICHP